jgi:hypothetical protein
VHERMRQRASLDLAGQDPGRSSWPSDPRIDPARVVLHEMASKLARPSRFLATSQNISTVSLVPFVWDPTRERVVVKVGSTSAACAPFEATPSLPAWEAWRDLDGQRTDMEHLHDVSMDVPEPVQREAGAHRRSRRNVEHWRVLRRSGSTSPWIACRAHISE